MARVMLAAGGTGGHIFPALAVGDYLQQQGHDVLLLTDKRGETMVMGKISYKLISAASPFQKGIFNKMLGLVRLGIGFLQSLGAMIVKRPKAVIGFGGYPSFAPIMAGRIMRAKCILHEQNAVMGRANRMLAQRVHEIALSFAITKGAPSQKNITLTGLPVRAAFHEIAPYQPVKSGYHILVIGGSLGAQIFADIIPQAIARLPDALKGKITLTQQARDEHIAPLKQAYQTMGLTADVARFFHNIPDLCEASDLIISRSGASSVQEIATSGRPALLIPFAGAMDDHQTGNAMRLVEAGGAVMIDERTATAEILSQHLLAILTDDRKRQDMAKAGSKLGHENASAAIAALTGLVPRLSQTSAPDQGMRS